jgi:hypothetical protein
MRNALGDFLKWFSHFHTPKAVKAFPLIHHNQKYTTCFSGSVYIFNGSNKHSPRTTGRKTVRLVPQGASSFPDNDAQRGSPDPRLLHIAGGLTIPLKL